MFAAIYKKLIDGINIMKLSKDYDSIDVGKKSKGGVTTAHNAITATATSVEIDTTGYNWVSVECAVSAIASGNWAIELTGCAVAGGTYGTLYKLKDDGTQVAYPSVTLNANGTAILQYFIGGVNYIKVKATRTTDGTLTCKVTPFNV
jgi:hypothetical protein